MIVKTPATWDEDVVETPTAPPQPTRVPIDLNALTDGRCKASTWRGGIPAKPTYENHFGPGGYNRCIGTAGHDNPLHKDDWGYVFTVDDAGRVRIVRLEDRA